MNTARNARLGLRRYRSAPAIVPAALLVLTACGGPSRPVLIPHGQAKAGPALDANPSNGQAPTSNLAGCPAGDADIPTLVTGAEVPDLDGDGHNDRVWLGLQDNNRLLGVQTASGGNFSTVFFKAQSSRYTATANRLGDGMSIILMASHDSVGLYAVIDCRIVPTKDTQGNPYVFNLGLPGHGTGVACLKDNTGLYLAGYDTEPDDQGGSGLVTRTRIELSRDGTQAKEGKITTLGPVSHKSSQWREANHVTCGNAKTTIEPTSGP